jgi:hypothetical protein
VSVHFMVSSGRAASTAGPWGIESASNTKRHRVRPAAGRFKLSSLRIEGLQLWSCDMVPRSCSLEIEPCRTSSDEVRLH